jgi:hypothetical protein
MKISVGGQLGASLLLFSDYWDRLALAADGEVIVALPNQEALFVSSTQMNGGGTAALQLEIERKRSFSDAEHASSNLLVWRKGRWEVFGPAEQVQIAI